MRTEDYFRSISAEMEALKDRVRFLISDSHWPTDGEWKESVLRTVIRRSAPKTLSVGRGFVVSGERSSTQLDILIYDNTHPVLYRDGDLVFVSPAACRAVIEVKSSINSANFSESCNKLGSVANLVRRSPGGRRTFIGLFSYESRVRPNRALEILAESSQGDSARVIDHVVNGQSNFIKWWALTPQGPRTSHNSWHAYTLPSMAAGYFVHNLLLHLSPHAEQENESIWFPEQSKEQFLVQERAMPPRM